MPVANAGRPEPVTRFPWMWGVSFGLVVGFGVLAISTSRYGLRISNLVLGVVVFIVFGLVGIVGGVARRHTPGGPV